MADLIFITPILQMRKLSSEMTCLKQLICVKLRLELWSFHYNAHIIMGHASH